ncbi:MAG: MFS transporter [Parvularculales bacterium]
MTVADIETSLTGHKTASRIGQVSWALFEWARTPYVILITIYIFAPYFSSTVIGDPVRGQALWGYINGFAGFVVAGFAPFLGAIADNVGNRKPWIISMTAIMAPALFLLWFAMPGGGVLDIAFITLLIVIITVAYEFSTVFHNAMLPDIVSSRRVGFLSGLGLSLGNAGSLILLIFMLYAFALPASGVTWGFIPDAPLFGIDPSLYEESRISGPLTSLWFVIFALPLFFLTPDVPRSSLSMAQCIHKGLRSVIKTLQRLKHYKNIALYLVARMLYNDGKTAILIFGGVYASGTFGWGATELLIYGIFLSVFAVCGGVFGGWLADIFKAKTAIMITIGGTLIGMITAASMQPDEILFMPFDAKAADPVWSLGFLDQWPEIFYMAAGAVLAVFITGAYATSRTMLARIAPPSMMTEFYGLYALSGTATAFVGPMLVAFSTDITDSLRAGFLSISVLLAAGMVGMIWVREETSVAME